MTRAHCLIKLSAFAAAAAASVHADAIVAKYSNDDTLFGHLNQRTLPQPLGDFACGPVALANSLAYLQRAFPNHYVDAQGNRTLIPDTEVPPNMMIDPADIAAVALILAAPAYMDTKLPGFGGLPTNFEPNLPYYDPNIHGHNPWNPAGGDGGGTTWEDFAFGKDCYLTRPGLPQTEMCGQLRDMWTSPRNKPGWLDDGVVITADDIAEAIYGGKDVEIGFTWQKLVNGVWVEQNGGHYVTATGFEFDDLDGDGEWDMGEAVERLQFIDPWNDLPIGPPAVENAPDLVGDLTMVGNDLFLQYNGGAVSPANVGMLRGRIKIWAGEIPEPASLMLLAVAVGVLLRR